MNHTVVRIFDNVEQAQHAREAMLAAGFGADAVSMSVTGDEAGAVAGNFYVGNPHVGNPPGAGGDDSYQRTYADPRPSSQCIVTVDTGDDDGAMVRAAGILEQFGARQSDPALRGPH
ncbi:MAG: hypothetical protein ACJ8HI_15055 [Massilia sp.]